MHRLLAGAAHPVQRDRRDVHREAGLEHGQAGQVGALVADRSDAAPDHVFDPARSIPARSHSRLHHDRAPGRPAPAAAGAARLCPPRSGVRTAEMM